MFPMTLKTADECAAVTKAVEQSIDSHLEAFVKSKFEWRGERRKYLRCEIEDDELQLLLRRLTESDNGPANSLACDIVFVEWGEEPR